MNKSFFFPLLLLVSQMLWGQFAFHNKDAIAGLDLQIAHVLPQPNSDPLYALQLQLSGHLWIEPDPLVAAQLFLATQHRFTLPFNNSKKTGLNTDLLPLIYQGEVSFGSHLATKWEIWNHKNTQLTFDINWFMLESLLLPFKNASWHEISLRMVNNLAVSFFFNENHFLRFSIAPFFFVPGLAMQNYSGSNGPGYTFAVSPSGHFHTEIGFYSRLKESWSIQITDNRPYLGVFLGLQLYLPELSWINSAPDGIDWSHGTRMAQLHLGMKTWLPPPGKT